MFRFTFGQKRVLNVNWIGEADKYSENDPVPCSIDDLSVTEIRDELKKIGVKRRLKNRETVLDLLKSKQ